MNKYIFETKTEGIPDVFTSEVYAETLYDAEKELKELLGGEITILSVKEINNG